MVPISVGLTYTSEGGRSIRPMVGPSCGLYFGCPGGLKGADVQRLNLSQAWNLEAVGSVVNMDCRKGLESEVNIRCL